MNTVNAMITGVLDYAYQQNPQFLNYLDRVNVEASLQEAIAAVIPTLVTLGSERPDAEAILLRLVQDLQNRGAWRDTVPTATGQTLLRDISAGLSSLQFSVVRAQQENHLHTAQARSSIYSIMNGQGVSIRRRVPARARVRFSIPDHTGVFQIPRFSQFEIAGQSWFNRDVITFTEFELTRDVELAQGVLYSMDGVAAGTPFETVQLGFENYLVSDTDVVVWVNGVEWKVAAHLEPWRAARDEQVYFARTLETGNVELKFGSGAFAAQLEAGDAIRVVWAETQGRDNPGITTAMEFVYNKLPLIVEGLVLGMSGEGDNELDLDFYRNVGPYLRSADGTASRRAELRAVALRYPQVVDAVFRGQAELNPGRKSFTNVMAATVLTARGVPLTNAEWLDFVAYMEANSQDVFDFQRYDPTLIRVQVSMDVFCRSTASLVDVERETERQLLTAFGPRRGAINYPVYVTDLVKAMRQVPVLKNGVEYLDNVQFSYLGTPPTLPEGAGVNGDDVQAKGYSVVLLEKVVAKANYTTRESYQGRRDLA